MALQQVGFIDMISSNFYSLLFLLMLVLSMFSFTVLFALFIYRDLGGVKFTRDSFLFFDYIFFNSDMRTSASALSVICVFIFGLAFNHNRNLLVKNCLVDMVQFLDVILFFIHYRFLFNLEHGKTKIILVREFFFNLEIKLRLIFLWLSRLLSIILILNRFYRWFVVENNLLGSNEYAHAVWIRQHGIDMTTCTENSLGIACQKAMDERDIVGLALVTGAMALLPGNAQIIWGLGASVNTGIDYLANGAIGPVNATITGWGNVFNMGNGLAGTVGWNVAGGTLGSQIGNKDSLSGAISNGIGSAARYGIGKGIIWRTDRITNVVGKWVTNGWDPKYDPTRIKYAEVNHNDIIREGMKPNNIPRTAGDIGDSMESELGGKVADKVPEGLRK